MIKEAKDLLLISETQTSAHLHSLLLRSPPISSVCSCAAEIHVEVPHIERGIKPGWLMIKEAEEILLIHKQRHQKYRQTLSCTHFCYNPLQSVEFIHAQLKFMLRYLTLNVCLEGKDGTGGTDFGAVLSNHLVEEHLYYVVQTLHVTKTLQRSDRPRTKVLDYMCQ